MVASDPSTAAIWGFSSSGSWSMAFTTPRSAVCNCASGQETTPPLGSPNVVFSARSARSVRIWRNCGSVRNALKPVTVISSLRPRARMNSLRLPLLMSMVEASLETIFSKSPSSAAISPFTDATRPLTNSEANVKRWASSSRIFRRGPSPGLELGHEVPLVRSISAFEVETAVSWISVACNCSSRVEAACRDPCTCPTALSAEREASPRLSRTFQ